MIRTYFGPMGAKKTKTLLDLRDEVYFKERVLVFSPVKDDRFGIGKIKDRDRKRKKVDAIPIEDIFDIENHLKRGTKYIFIDEVNFFESEEKLDKGIDLYELEKRRYESMRLILKLSLEKRINFNMFGLNLTAEMIPYGLMPAALAYADERKELFAECAECGDSHAKFTYYIPYEKDTL